MKGKIKLLVKALLTFGLFTVIVLIVSPVMDGVAFLFGWKAELTLRVVLIAVTGFIIAYMSAEEEEKEGKK